MKITLEIDASSLIASLPLNQIKVAAQDAMAYQFSEITIGNFGPGDGIDRPIDWPSLSPLYAIRKHGGDTTPTEILSTDLMMSIQVDGGNLEFSECYTDQDYAMIQQWGGKEWGRNIPARPFMPLIGDENESVLTPYTEQECINAAQTAIESVLN